MTHADDEFYIGYQATMPPGIGRRVRTTVTVSAAVVVCLAAMVTAVQRPLANSSFAFGQSRAWSGYLVRTPAPAILVPGDGAFERWWLVGRGKHGADAVLGTLAEGWVEVQGSEIARGPWRMIEASGARSLAPPAGTRVAPSLGVEAGRLIHLRGEIVDSKCFLGVMNPGERTVHRDCAIRCLSGGVPPMVSFVNDAGRQDLAVLVSPHGAVPPANLAPLVGRPVDLVGRLYTVGDALVLQLDSVSGGRR
ncbi:MAG: hypothetical protein OEW19_03685 [Acidobacteriota bacterium]|nr:hypothetical protein [Acidobacteriota bacterium]